MLRPRVSGERVCGRLGDGCQLARGPGRSAPTAGTSPLTTEWFLLEYPPDPWGEAMPSGDEAIRALRDALRVSPDNLPLRQHLADTLLEQGFPGEAEKEYLQALRLDPQNGRLKTGLASALLRQGKHQPALVIVRELLKGPDAPALARRLYAELLLRTGAAEQAAREYRAAVDADPSLADPDLTRDLGLDREPDTSESVGGRLRAPVKGFDAPLELAPERPPVTFSDVGGMEALKEEIRMKIIYPLLRPELYQAYGKAVGGGILLYGPPGCGKTHLARATAGEVQAGFLSVGIHDVLDMWIGQSERNLHELFERARAQRPCVLFFDEVDALGASRGDMRQSAGRHLINQFLAELDGIQHSNEGLLILAATNAPWHLDPAFRRPGRFDRVLFVPPPDLAAREAILRVLCRGKPVVDLDYATVAAKTERYSGADLKAIVDLGVEQKLRQALREGVRLPLTTKDLLSAAKAVRPSTTDWFATARNYALYANQGRLYDDILRYLKL